MRFAAGAALLALSLAGCGKVITSTGRSVFMLVDASGSYSAEIPAIAVDAKHVVARMQANDWLGAAQISSCSFADTMIIPGERFPGRPSEAMDAQSEVFETLETYAAGEHRTQNTDIRGALAGAAMSLRQSHDARRFVVVFSDMVEDVAPDCDTASLDLDLAGLTVIVNRMSRLPSDGRNPEQYTARIEHWRQIVTEAGGKFVYTDSRDALLNAVMAT
jgi:hypothetical protein